MSLQQKTVIVSKRPQWQLAFGRLHSQVALSSYGFKKSIMLVPKWPAHSAWRALSNSLSEPHVAQSGHSASPW